MHNIESAGIANATDRLHKRDRIESTSQGNCNRFKLEDKTLG